MNILIEEIVRSLRELDLGLKGQLTISDDMEALISSLAGGTIPLSWSKLAYACERGLASWLSNLLRRIDQLDEWKVAPDIPEINLVYINRLFNPKSYLTAIT